MKVRPIRSRLTLLFVILNLTINFLSMLLLWIIGLVLVRSGIVSLEAHSHASRIFAVVVLSVSQLLSCTLVAMAVSKHTLKPINKTIDAMAELEKGNFSHRLHLKGTKGSRAFAASFNRMAEELQNTEMLRSDFVNNFSHEFKTPIVSILGFSRLLKKGCVTPEEQQEYLTIIEEEALRLSQMATNVLYMTKLENTSILTGVTRYNLSEQLRNSLLLLEKQWSEKNLELELQFEELMISANEELLKEVWINLLDNAVKFTPHGGELGITAEAADGSVIVRISNSGVPISAEDLPRIFGKFYQSDTSHSAKGTGLGLSIAQHIVRLHDGTISVTSDERCTVFTVTLPA